MHIFCYSVTLGSHDSLHGGVHVFSELQLLVSHHPLLLEQRLIALETELYVEHILLAILYRIAEALECHHLLALRRYIEFVHLTIGNLLTLFEECPHEVVVAEVSEEVLIVHLYLSLLQVFCGSPYILVVVAHLIRVGMIAAVCSDDTVTVEVIV